MSTDTKPTESTLKIDDPAAAALQLEAWGSIGSAIDGPMETRGHEMWRGAGERVGTGIWECDAGRFTARFADRGEFIHIVTGRMTCTAEDGTVTEIMLNADGRVWIDQAGRSLRTGVTMDPPKALAILRAVAGQADLQLTSASPSLDAELRPWGARVKAAIPPITKAPVFTIRKPPVRVFTLDEYVEAAMVTAGDVVHLPVAARRAADHPFLRRGG